MFTYILIGVAAVIVLFVIVVAMQSPKFRIARKTLIAAAPQQVFPHVNDFHEWIGWSPWEKYDPALKRTYEGPPAGVGAVYRWVGNKNVGEGQSTITESRPHELVRIKLEFQKPFKATNDVEFTFVPEGNQTAVSWIMTGERNFMFKAIGLVMNMDKMCGGQFEQGLANLKSVVESSDKAERKVAHAQV